MTIDKLKKGFNPTTILLISAVLLFLLFGIASPMFMLMLKDGKNKVTDGKNKVTEIQKAEINEVKRLATCDGFRGLKWGSTKAEFYRQNNNKVYNDIHWKNENNKKTLPDHRKNIGQDAQT